MIGINTAIASPTGFNADYGFAVPISLARAVMDQLIKTGRVERAALGILVRDASPEDAEYAGLGKVSGVLVQDEAGWHPAGRYHRQRRRQAGGVRGATSGGDCLPEAG